MLDSFFYTDNFLKFWLVNISLEIQDFMVKIFKHDQNDL